MTKRKQQEEIPTVEEWVEELNRLTGFAESDDDPSHFTVIDVKDKNKISRHAADHRLHRAIDMGAVEPTGLKRRVGSRHWAYTYRLVKPKKSKGKK